MLMTLVLFWIGLLLLGYIYVGYPALLGVWARLRPRPPRRRDIQPGVTVVVVAHNEAARIDRRLANLLALEYPRDRLDVILASDGSTDETVERARAYEREGVTVVAFETRRGKPAVLDDVLPQARGEIVVFSDARQLFDGDALQALVAPFADPRVGAVSGELVLGTEQEQRTHVGEGVGFYWRYEKFIRRHESRLDSTVGVTGAIYAIRRHLFEPIPEDTILDDVLIPVGIVRQGYRVLFVPEARAWDQVATTAQEEFTRKVRTIAGNFQLFARERWLLNPLRNRLWFQTISHKCLRLLSPLLLMEVLGLNLLLLQRPFYRWTLAAQVLFYLSALLGNAVGGVRRKIPLLGVAFVFCFLNWVTIVAFIRFISGGQRVTWEKAWRSL